MKYYGESRDAGWWLSVMVVYVVVIKVMVVMTVLIMLAVVVGW